jgi:hypothetical protein
MHLKISLLSVCSTLPVTYIGPCPIQLENILFVYLFLSHANEVSLGLLICGKNPLYRPLRAACQAKFILRDLITLTHPLTHSWSWDLLEKRPVVQLLKNFPAFYGTRRFITWSQEPSTGPYPDPDQSNPYYPILSL